MTHGITHTTMDGTTHTGTTIILATVRDLDTTILTITRTFGTVREDRQVLTEFTEEVHRYAEAEETEVR